MQLVLIELDSPTSDFLSRKLGETGFRTHRVSSLDHFLQAGLNQHADALLLDANAAEQNLEGVVKRLRTVAEDLPLVVLCASGDWRTKVACLDAGADDALFKPVRSEEIAARIRAVMRCSQRGRAVPFAPGQVELDLKGRCAWLNGNCLDLTRTEFRLLSLLLLRPGQVLTQQEIRTRLYPHVNDCSLNAVEVQIARLRRKVGKERIRTVRGVGYRFVRDAQDAAAPDADHENRRSNEHLPEEDAQNTSILERYSDWMPGI